MADVCRSEQRDRMETRRIAAEASTGVKGEPCGFTPLVNVCATHGEAMPAPYSSDLSASRPFAEDALERVKGMFLEMPGTDWTVADAARLAGLDATVCRAILEALQQTGFVSQRNGRFVRCMLPIPRQSGDRRDLHG
jgi:hypothetical protein